MEKRDRRTESKLTRYKVEDGKEWCFCSSHGEFLPCEQFTKSKTYEHGYEYRCRYCWKNSIPSKFGTHQIKQQMERNIVDNFLKQCGYDPTSPVPVYEQFLIKHDL